MKANEAREAASKVPPSDKQLPIESYMKWVHGRIKARVNEGKYKVAPVFDGMETLPPNAGTCTKLGELLQADGYEVAFDDKGILVRISWDK